MVTLQLQQIQVPSGQSLLLKDVDWAEFEAIAIELGSHRRERLAYDRGVLEIMTPLPEHEYFKETLSIAIEDIAETLNRDYASYGSTTWRKPFDQAGLEPDNCFYFQNEAQIRGKLNIDLSQDPPPDLALEIDLTHKSLDRLPIYARLGVREVWCYNQGKLTIYQLQGGQYVSRDRSQVFPSLPLLELPQLLETHRDQGRLSLRRAVRAWVQQHQAN